MISQDPHIRGVLRTLIWVDTVRANPPGELDCHESCSPPSEDDPRQRSEAQRRNAQTGGHMEAGGIRRDSAAVELRSLLHDLRQYVGAGLLLFDDVDQLCEEDLRKRVQTGRT